jgi:glycosyltransferase A (GT-A) superfamily protein (DUF2064 family)
VALQRKLASPFRGIGWSQRDTLEQVLRQLVSRRVANVRTLSDMDSAADVRALKKPPGRRIR